LLELLLLSLLVLWQRMLLQLPLLLMVPKLPHTLPAPQSQ